MRKTPLTLLLVVPLLLAGQESPPSAVKVQATLLDASGKPVPDVTLAFYPIPSQPAARTQAGESGTFQVELPPGEYQLRTSLCGVEPMVFRTDGSSQIVLRVAAPVRPNPGFGMTEIKTGWKVEPWGVGIHQDYTYKPGGHVVQTGLCDPRLIQQAGAADKK
jgi:hypothetical protein